MLNRPDLRDELRALPTPAALTPDEGLADTVLVRLRRQRRARATVGVMALVVLLTLIPLWGQGVFDNSATTPTGSHGQEYDIEFPAPGGGPQVVHVYTYRDVSYLLDGEAGGYRRLPFRVALSPDSQWLAVSSSTGTGIVRRDELLENGPAAVDWFEAPAGSLPTWSPDGDALVFLSSEDTDIATPGYRLHRYDLAAQQLDDMPLGSLRLADDTISWAPDGRRYLLNLLDDTEEAQVRYLEADGTVGGYFDTPVAGIVLAAPGRAFAVVDAFVLTDPVQKSLVLDLHGEGDATVRSFPPDAKPLGWYDGNTIVLASTAADGGTILEVVRVDTGATLRQLPLSGGYPQSVGIGSSDGLTGPAADYGF